MVAKGYELARRNIHLTTELRLGDDGFKLSFTRVSERKDGAGPP